MNELSHMPPPSLFDALAESLAIAAAFNKEPERPKDEYPWFWTGDVFTGDRVNDVHITNAQKQAARKMRSCS